MLKRLFVGAGLALLAAAAVAGPVEVGDLQCLPNERNGYVEAQFGEGVAFREARLFFRRLHPAGAFYFTRMFAGEDGAFWGTFPKPEQREQEALTDEWWGVLETRDWMQVEGRDRDWLESWLEDQEYEAAEYYVALFDDSGELVERSEVHLVPVVGYDECEIPMTERMWGWARNLTIGETTERQFGKPVLHWLCDGVATRISWQGIIRADDYCRACVVGAVGEEEPSC